MKSLSGIFLAILTLTGCCAEGSNCCGSKAEAEAIYHQGDVVQHRLGAQGIILNSRIVNTNYYGDDVMEYTVTVQNTDGTTKTTEWYERDIDHLVSAYEEPAITEIPVSTHENAGVNK